MKQMEIRDYDGIPPFRVRRTAGKKRSGCFSSVHSLLRMIIYLAGILAIANLILSWLVPDIFPDEFLNEMTSPPESFQQSTPPTSLTYRTFLQNFGDVQVLKDETYGDCMRTGGQLRHCEHDEFILHEPLIHPALITHPFPRKVLIAGGADGALIREALKHFLLTKIDVVGFDKKMSALTKKHLPKSCSYDDILSRVETHETPLLDFLVASKERYDAIIVDFASGNGNIPTLATESEWSDFVQLAKTRLSKGGIVSTRTGEASMEQGNFWEAHKAMTGKFKHSHIYTQHQPSNAITWGYHLSFDTDAFADPRSLAPSYVDVLLARRMPEGTQHYDGVSHLNMFNIPRWMRLKAERFAVNADFPVSHAPHKEGHIDRLHPVHIRGETVQREFFGCNPEVLEDVANLEAAMREGLTKYAHAKIIGIKTDVFTTYQNLTGLDVEFDGQANDESEPVHIVVYLALAEGSVVLHSYPAFNYAVAVFTNFNSWVVPNELFGSLFEKIGSARTVGSSISMGPPNPIQSATAIGPNVNYLDYVVSYDETDALEVHGSPTAGNGQFATRNIKKGSLIYYGPIEQYLVHEDEMAMSPRWLQDYYNHMGENAEKSIWVAPGSFDEDNSYFTNHNCDPNLVYAGYDIMKARRDIPKGAELTFDYATVDAVKEDFKCNCGSPKCRGKVTSDDWKNDTYVAELGIKHFWPHVQKKILLAQRTRNHKI